MTISRREFNGALLALGGAASIPGVVRAQGRTSGIDCHAHVFKRGLKLADVRRYAPDYDATPEDYLRMLDANGMSHGVLIQPSFLGTDNSYMVEALKAHPERLRGVAVVEPTTPAAELEAMAKSGVVGLRLNLVGLPDPPLKDEPWRSLLKAVKDLGWQIEIHAEAKRLPALVAPLVEAGVKTVVDHFGRPDGAQGVDDAGFKHLLSTGASRLVWVKVSGAYRNGKDGAGERTALAAIPMLKQSFGLDRLVWGSDWPHTQFEQTISYAAMRKQLDEWLPDPAERKAVLWDTPSKLFRFDRS